ncbi:MAG: hypothetical protein LBF40_02650 [Deltaproteobacteria bacterium]|jgi:hypothetical protein|nr:hypothetical protein [Deltaproteobacteria bacterium]
MNQKREKLYFVYECKILKLRISAGLRLENFSSNDWVLALWDKAWRAIIYHAVMFWMVFLGVQKIGPNDATFFLREIVSA